MFSGSQRHIRYPPGVCLPAAKHSLTARPRGYPITCPNHPVGAAACLKLAATSRSPLSVRRDNRDNRQSRLKSLPQGQRCVARGAAKAPSTGQLVWPAYLQERLQPRMQPARHLSRLKPLPRKLGLALLAGATRRPSSTEDNVGGALAATFFLEAQEHIPFSHSPALLRLSADLPAPRE